jgi:DNA polymerase III subunit epsilon
MTPRTNPPEGPLWDGPVDRAALAFVDLEMTGLDVGVDRVIEVCIERYVGSECVGKMCSLVRPDDGRFGNEAVHGIKPEDVLTQPTFAELSDEIEKLLAGAVLVAHGASYDVAFLEVEFKRAGRPFAASQYLDTLTLSRRVFGFPSHALQALAKSLELEVSGAHRAEADVLTLRRVFERVMAQLKPTNLRDLWSVKVAARMARPEVLAALASAVEAKLPVKVRYRPSGKPAADLVLVVTSLRSDLDPPHVLGYLLPGRGRRELRADRILSVTAT